MEHPPASDPQTSAKGQLSHLPSPTVSFKGGHRREVLALQFHSDGKIFASAGVDRQICLIFFSYIPLIFSFYSPLVIWNVYDDCRNILAIPCHFNAILDLGWNVTHEFSHFLVPSFLYILLALFLPPVQTGPSDYSMSKQVIAFYP
jgi:WD40 repeat protein